MYMSGLPRDSISDAQMKATVQAAIERLRSKATVLKVFIPKTPFKGIMFVTFNKPKIVERLIRRGGLELRMADDESVPLVVRPATNQAKQMPMQGGMGQYLPVFWKWIPFPLIVSFSRPLRRRAIPPPPFSQRTSIRGSAAARRARSPAINDRNSNNRSAAISRSTDLPG